MGPVVHEDGPRGPGQKFTSSSIIPWREPYVRRRVLMVIDDIRDLLAAPNPAAAKPFLERVDATLTDGYAHALQLEAERWRIERRIAEVVAALPADTDREHESSCVAWHACPLRGQGGRQGSRVRRSSTTGCPRRTV